MRKVISGPIASHFCVFPYWNAFMCFGINCVKRTEWECFTPSVDACLCGKHMWSVTGSQQSYTSSAATRAGLPFSIGQDSSNIIGKTKGNFDWHPFCVDACQGPEGTYRPYGLPLLGSQPWPGPWTQRLHLSSVLAWAVVRVCLFPVLHSGWTLDACSRQLVSWMDASDVYYSLSPALSLALWTLNSCCSLVSSPVSGPVSFHPWLGSLDGPWTWFIACLVWGCWWTLLPAPGSDTMVRSCRTVSL